MAHAHSMSTTDNYFPMLPCHKSSAHSSSAGAGPATAAAAATTAMNPRIVFRRKRRNGDCNMAKRQETAVRAKTKKLEPRPTAKIRNFSHPTQPRLAVAWCPDSQIRGRPIPILLRVALSYHCVHYYNTSQWTLSGRLVDATVDATVDSMKNHTFVRCMRKKLFKTITFCSHTTSQNVCFCRVHCRVH